MQKIQILNTFDMRCQNTNMPKVDKFLKANPANLSGVNKLPESLKTDNSYNMLTKFSTIVKLKNINYKLTLQRSYERNKQKN